MTFRPPEEPARNWWELPISEAVRFPVGGAIRASGALPRPPLDVAAGRLRLDDSRRDRVESAVQTMRRRLAADEKIAPLLRRVFVQGSFALKTLIQPTASAQFDVDLVIVLDLRRLPLLEITPANAIDVIESGLKSTAWYRQRLVRRSRCLRIIYEDGFHVDIVPSHADTPYSAASGPLFIPNRSRDTWEPTHPLAYQAWFEDRNRKAGGRLREIVLLMKRWRDRRPQVLVPSLLLSTLLGYSASGSAFSLARSLSDTLSSLDGLLARHRQVPIVANPSLSTEDLARDWTQSAFEQFSAELRNASVLARAALQRGVNPRPLWQELFGDVVPA